LERKAASGIVLTLLLIGILTLAFKGQPVKSESLSYETTFRRAEPAVIVTDLDPSTQFSNEIVIICGNMYESLTWVNPEGEVVPKLATSWNVSDDGLTWNFTLREGVKFHDGTLMNSTAVKLSIERTHRMMYYGAGFIWDCVENITTFGFDPYLIQFTLKYPAPLDKIAASAYGSWVFSPKVFEHGNDTQIAEWLYPSAGPPGGIFAGDPPYDVGTGPYYLYSYEPGGTVVMKKFDDYWGGWEDGPYYETIITDYVDEVATREDGILGETYDFTYILPREDLASINASELVRVADTPSFQNLLGFLNTKRYPTNITLVRQALAYAVPYQRIIDEVLMGYGVQSKGPVPAGLFGHVDDLFQYTQNITKAQELFAAAGVDPVGLDLILTYHITDPDEAKVAEIMKEEFDEKLGIDLDIRGMEWAAYWTLARSDPTVAQHIFLMYWWPTVLSGYDFLMYLFHTEPEIFFNLGYYYNSTFDDLIDTAYSLEATDPTTSLQKYRQAQEMLLDDCPSIFFYDLDNTHVIREVIGGYIDNPAYPHVVFYYNLTPPPIDGTPPIIDSPSRVPSGEVAEGQPAKVSVNVTDAESGVKNVILSYTINNGTTWTNITMNYNSTTRLYEETIQGQTYCTWVKYRIIAYNNAGKRAIGPDAGEYYAYHVIPEFPSATILPLFMVLSLIIAALAKRKTEPKHRPKLIDLKD